MRRGLRMTRIGIVVVAMCVALVPGPPLGAQAPAGVIQETDARRWLTDLSSDLMQGRGVFTEGYGLASAYVAGELRAMGIEPMGQEGSYFQPVVRRTVAVTQQSRVVVRARGESRTFAHGDHVTFPALVGGRQTLTFKGVTFVGYGLGQAGGADEARRAASASGRFVAFMPGRPASASSTPALPRSLSSAAGRALALVRAPNTIGAAVGFQAAPRPPAASGGAGPDVAPPPPGRGRGRGAAAPADGTLRATTTTSLDALRAPSFTGDEEFFEFLLADLDGGFAGVRDKASRGEPLPMAALDAVEVTIEIEAPYQTVSTERTQNVVARVRGADAALADEYVLFGAHLDHVGYVAGTEATGRANTPVADDPIWNGADDDGSGSTAVLAIAKAFSTGPRPKRSALFVWHAGEEVGLIGSEHMAQNPVVPLEKIQAVFNIDMIGRNRDDKPEQADTVFLIGADRISTDLHNLIVDANGRLARPLTIDFEYNDPADSNSFYTRSDHYSYASRGVPSAFFFTGTHPDYHANTDTVDKILFPKLVRITDFIYRAGFATADRPAGLVRDQLGPRAGRGFSGPLGR